MRRTLLGALMISFCLMLTACGQGEGGGESRVEELALTIRGEYLSMESCAAKLALTADYGERVYEYGLDMNWHKEKGYTLMLTEPEDVSGVTILVEAGQTALEYDGARIETGAVTPDGLSPIDAIPMFFTYAREGFMAACTEENMDGTLALRMDFRDPEATAGVGLEASLWFCADTHGLLRAELSSDGVTVIQCAVADFQMA